MEQQFRIKKKNHEKTKELEKTKAQAAGSRCIRLNPVADYPVNQTSALYTVVGGLLISVCPKKQKLSMR